MVEKIKSLKVKVTQLLVDKESNRDSDNKLIANIWHSQIGGSNIAKMSAMELLKLISDGSLASPESIRRVRQKVQETNLSLRGKSYKKRKEIAEEVRTNIHTV